MKTIALLSSIAVLAVSPVRAAEEGKVSFVKDVMPILNKAGCTSGPCHGSAKGKAGFKLSLRGYDPDFDYRALIHELQGRRYNRTEPAKSLIILKPTQQIPHGGGLRFDEDSPYYKTIVRWLSEGAEFGDAAGAKVTKLAVTPAEIVMNKPGEKQQLEVIAHYADGGTRNVTKEAMYTSNTPIVAEITPAGFIASQRKGESAMLVQYEGQLSVVPLTVLPDKSGFAWPNPPANNYIDKFLYSKLQKVRVLPSELASDAEFLRRVSLDLIGVPPTIEETKAFLADPAESKAKRAKVIDALMSRPEFVNHWSVKWGDLLQVNRRRLGDKGMWTFRNWIRDSIATNKPYDRMVRELITASGSTYENPPANYFRFTRDPKVAMETTTQLFLGVRMVCAQCHDHPFEKWTQNQYFHLAAFFSGVGIKDGADSVEEVIYEKREDRDIKHPKDGRLMPAKFLYPVETMSPRELELRSSLAEWLTSPKNELFGKAIANRMWSYFFGRGIIEPVDDIRASNPPSNPELLDALTRDFVANGYDLRRLIKTIVNSRTYQLSFQANEWNDTDEVNFSHALPRRLSAEQLYDGIYTAAGSKPFLAEVPREFKAQDFPDSNVGVGGFLDLFGRPERQTSCECERRSDVSLVQALNLVNGGTIADAIADEQGRIARLVLGGANDRKIIEELYLAALGRPPQSRELDLGQTYMAGGLNRAERAQDLLWALLNSNAFLFNR